MIRNSEACLLTYIEEQMYNNLRLGRKSLHHIIEEIGKNIIDNIKNNSTPTIKERLKFTKQLTSEIEKSLKSNGSPYLTIDAETTTNLIVGSATGPGALIYEIGLSWDPVLDLPVIRGSALKGVVRSWLEDYLETMESDGELTADEREEMVNSLFGYTSTSSEENGQGSMSTLMFYDAYPIDIKDRLLIPDIINPHYNTTVNPSLRTELDVNPVPVVHLTVAPHVTFRIIISAPPSERQQLKNVLNKTTGTLGEILSRNSRADTPPKDWSKVIALIALAALYKGVGGRTLKGYGEMKPVNIRFNLGGDKGE